MRIAKKWSALIGHHGEEIATARNADATIVTHDEDCGGLRFALPADRSFAAAWWITLRSSTLRNSVCRGGWWITLRSSTLRDSRRASTARHAPVELR
jgi:hypothetical protein